MLLTTLRPGDVLVMAAECYYATRRLASGLLTDIGVQVQFVADDDVIRPSRRCDSRVAGKSEQSEA